MIEYILAVIGCVVGVILHEIGHYIPAYRAGLNPRFNWFNSKLRAFTVEYDRSKEDEVGKIIKDFSGYLLSIIVIILYFGGVNFFFTLGVFGITIATLIYHNILNK